MLAPAALGRTTQRRRVEDCRRERPLAIGITHCFAKPHARENYVKVWLAVLPQRPRRSSAAGPPRSSSTHSCDLRIVAVMDIYA